jgi:hypothetical protein
VTKTATGRRSLRKEEEWWVKTATGRRLCTRVNIAKNSKQQPKTRDYRQNKKWLKQKRPGGSVRKGTVTNISHRRLHIKRTVA